MMELLQKSGIAFFLASAVSATSLVAVLAVFATATLQQLEKSSESDLPLSFSSTGS